MLPRARVDPWVMVAVRAPSPPSRETLQQARCSTMKPGAVICTALTYRLHTYIYIYREREVKAGGHEAVGVLYKVPVIPTSRADD